MTISHHAEKIRQNRKITPRDGAGHITIRDLLARFHKPRKTGTGWMARCPAHDDRHASLSISEGQDGRILMYCHAGCTTEAVTAALGVTMNALSPPREAQASQRAGAPQKRIVATYDYRDEAGALRYQVLRYGPKEFRQRRPDGRGGWLWNLDGVERVLYRLPELMAANPQATVFVVEGEKDVDALTDAGLLATCNTAGAGKWRDDYGAYLRGRDVIILPDNDEPGRRHAEQVAQSLHGIAASIRILALPGLPLKGDVSDWLAAGGDAERLCVMADAAPDWTPAPATPETITPDDAPGHAETISAALIRIIGQKAHLFRDAGNDCYASITVNGHQETHRLESRHLRDWLARALWQEDGRVAGADKLAEVFCILRAKARFEGQARETHVRVAECDGAIYLDLCNADWQQAEITVTDWRIIESADSPIRFRRASGMLPLPAPTKGGNLRELRALLNLAEDDDDNWPLLLAWLIATFKPCNAARFAYPLLAIHGEQGSAKTTTARLLRRLVDPNKADLRATPRDERDLAIAAEHGRILAFDNLTSISDSLSNALCRIATGGGFATRALYTDEEEKIFESQRPVLLNGIAEVVSKSDLLDRAILIYLPRIPSAKRRLERVIERQFEAAQPKILGALLDAVCSGLRRMAVGVELDGLPRLADFAEWAVACEPGLGLTEGQFLAAYKNNIDKANGLAIETSPVAQAIVALIDDCKFWEGYTGGLLRTLNGRLAANGENPERKNGWPKSARALGAKLKEYAPNLRRSGVAVEFGERTRNGYSISLSRGKTQEQGKDVHNVHDVHAPNKHNGLGREHVREHVLPADPDNVHAPDREHLSLAASPDVHGHVHTVTYSN